MSITLVTRQSKARYAATAWHRQYPPESRSKTDDKLSIGLRLRNLGPNPDPDTIDRIIGNKSWTQVQCDICEYPVKSAVRFYKDFDLTTPTTVCQMCLNNAMDLIK